MSFHVHSFSGFVEPTLLDKTAKNVKVKMISEDKVVMEVRVDDSDLIEAILHLTIFDDISRERKISLDVTLYGEAECGVQTMWNAVDLWVKESSNFYSLLELYGHFTEPHPIFKVDSFENYSKLPVFKFAEHCMDFKNCSVYFDKEHLLKMWGDSFDEKEFIGLAKLLRHYRFDVRSHETNIAIPQGVYMVTYPFTLPFDKQMNCCVNDRGN